MKDKNRSAVGPPVVPDVSTPESRVLAAAAQAHPTLYREGYRQAWSRRVTGARIWLPRKAS